MHSDANAEAHGASPQSPIQNPHDKLFRHTFSDVEKAADFLKGVLPTHIFSKLDIQSLVQDKDSFVDEKLAGHFADVVYRANYGEKNQLEIAFLFEHKTKQPETPHLQLLRYILQLWESRDQNGEMLQPVLPILVYHGKKAWKVRKFDSYFGEGEIPEELLPYTPHFEFLLIDLHSTQDAVIKANFDIPTLRLTLLLMKYIYSPDLISQLPHLFNDFINLLKEEGKDGNLRAVFVYLLNFVKEVDKPKVMEIIEEYSESGARKGSIMWAAEERGREKGVAEGIEKGIKNGKERVALNMLSKGFPLQQISDITQIPLARVKELQAEME